MIEVTIRIKGHLEKTWSDWFNGFEVIHVDEDQTLLKGMLQDQSALFGLLSKLRDLGLSLVEVSVK